MKYCTRFLLICLALLVAISLASPTLVLGQGGETKSAEEDSTKKDKKKKDLPLEPGRTLEFTTEEGSWISLDVSPDGQTIAFDMLGDLYSMPISGGTATRLTSGMAYDTQPRFSPDGKRLVFISDSTGNDNVWLLELDSKERRALTKDKTDSYLSPEWTPDGNYIVVSKAGARFAVAKLWLLHVDGGGGVALTKEEERNRPRNQQFKTIGAAFGDNERYIWYAQRRGDWQYNAIFPQYQLARYDRDTGESIVMTSRFGSAIRPTLSPDGKTLVYATRHEHETGLRIRDLASGEEKWLAYPVQRDDQEARATMDTFPGYSFTPDSRNIIVSYGGKIWKVPSDGGEAQNIAFKVDVDVPLGPEVRFDYEISDDPTFVARQIRDAVPSPDGKQIAFTALDRLWVMKLDDGEPKRLTKLDIGEHYPIWSPDGKWIAFVTWEAENGGHTTKVRSSGGKPTQLTDMAAVYRMPAWSPDGQRIVAIRAHARDLQESISFFRGGLAEQFVYVPANGGATVEIGPTEGRSAPHFTDNPDRIYAYNSREGLVSMRWDGTDVKAHVKVTGPKFPGARNPSNASVVLMAPRGDQALAQVNYDLYVVTVP
ncbi:amidohydrolase, partial [bacterium]|nr:amidohydrolase [bacterium]